MRYRSSPKATLAERLDHYSGSPTETGCVEWGGSIGSGGYGRLTFKGTVLLAHRAAYQYKHGPILDSSWVLHSCDNPRCVNTEHMRLGTPADNVSDRVNRNRGNVPCGSDSPHAKLCEDDVRLIRETSRSDTELALIYGVTRATIWAIKTRRSWKNLS